MDMYFHECNASSSVVQHEALRVLQPPLLSNHSDLSVSESLLLTINLGMSVTSACKGTHSKASFRSSEHFPQI